MRQEVLLVLHGSDVALWTDAVHLQQDVIGAAVHYEPLDGRFPVRYQSSFVRPSALRLETPINNFEFVSGCRGDASARGGCRNRGTFAALESHLFVIALGSLNRFIFNGLRDI